MTIGDLALRLRGLPTAADVPDAELVAAAAAHGVGPLLYAVRRGGAAAPLPPTVSAAFAEAARTGALVEAVQRRALDELLTALAADGVSPLLFKGTALAYSVYDEPWMRPRADTDLLVREADASRAAAVLERLGYRRIPRPSGRFVTQQFTYRGERGGVESLYDVHWRPFDPQVFAGVLPFEDLAARSVPFAAPGPGASRVGDADALVIACIHRIAHHYGDDTLIRLCDIDRLARRLEDRDWDHAISVVAAGRVAAVCLDGLLRTRALFETPLPRRVVETLRTASGEPSAAYLKRQLRRVDILVSDLRALPTWTARLSLIREHLFPPPPYARQRESARKSLPVWYLNRIARGVRHWFAPLN